jgi:hypothetical protein
MPIAAYYGWKEVVKLLLRKERAAIEMLGTIGYTSGEICGN